MTTPLTKKRIENSILAVSFLAIGFISGCDTLEPDAIDDETAVVINNEPIVLTPQTSGIIDLRMLITSSGNHRFSTGQPSHGSLESLGDQLLQYTPDDEFLSGKDGFKLSVFNANNEIVQEDSVIIIVTQDSTSMPCGAYALTDYVYMTENDVVIEVLANDVFCDLDSSLIVVEVPDLVIDGVPVPKSYFGSVEVLSGGRVKYTAGPSYAGSDKFIYTMRKPADLPNVGDPEITSYGFVYISSPQDSAAVCDSLSIANDYYTFAGDSMKNVTFYLPVSQNDMWCDPVNNFSFNIVDMPQGTWDYAEGNGFMYTFPAGIESGFKDLFTYEVCVDDECGVAEVTIYFE